MSHATKPLAEQEDVQEDISRINAASMIVTSSDRFERLVEAYLDFVWRSLRRGGVPDADVDDAVQQVFLVARDKIGDIRPGSERSFLFAVAIRVASHARRARARLESARERLSRSPVEGPPDPEHLTHERETRALLDHVLDAIPDSERAVFVLFELEEMSVKEVAEMLDLSVETVIARLRRARAVFSRKAQQMKTLHQKGVL